ncbi:hypothetical protein E6O75_ATG00194 [Venturia nashicola]|uniref:YTH domain-containing protein n=1 Tax=Venturia nashicola TaxID=86259 RepID=A0A4Z1PHU8_9PEZI|nr:hypothetical protein E6O75_ATG00194 [Venturia nashicola]
MDIRWVQRWFALPVLVEEQMGDQQLEDGTANTGENRQENSHLPFSKPSSQPSPGDRYTGSPAAPFYSQYSSLPAHQQQMNPPRYNPQPVTNQYPQGFSQSQHGVGFDMSAMAGSLPNYSPSSFPQPQYQHDQQRLSGASTPAVVYQIQHNAQYPPGGPPFANPAPYPSYGPVQYASYATGQISPNVPYSPYGTAHPRQAPGTAQYPQFPHQTSPQYYYYPTGYGATSPAQFQNPTGQIQFGYGGKNNSAGAFGPSATQDDEGRLSLLGDEHLIRREPSNSSLSAVPRGPPRKPKQSGHALWVGNLPPGATVLDLKDHFSRDATRDIESLFLISKSNCGFVNYRTEEACAAAMQRFHDSRFQGVRLVCRLRRISTPSPATPVGPASTAAENTRSPSAASPPRSPVPKASEESEDVESQLEGSRVEGSSNTTRVPERFFIVKSLTLQDLEQSVRNGIWATQAHNEQSLNKAFETADQVFLIFSANKSGEYFGYARMTSPIGANSDELKQLSQQSSVVEPADAPRKIPTQATEFAPKGHIIDDSARGTIFWEADISDQEDEEEERASAKGETGTEDTDDKPFRVEWISTNRLPFYRTRGLRNPWNANREVKIARDGTELETSCAKRLIQMFHRPGPPTGPVGISTSIPGMYPPDLGGGLPNQLGYQQ